MSDIVGKNEPVTKVACRSCKHFYREIMTVTSCAAFDRIPSEILSGENQHKTPLPGQGNEVVFEPED